MIAAAHRRVALLQKPLVADGLRLRVLDGDVAALAKAMADLSVAAHELRGQVASIDVNPLAVLPAGKGVRVVDAVVQRGN